MKRITNQIPPATDLFTISKPPTQIESDKHQGDKALIAIGEINLLSQRSKPELTLYNDRVYKSAIDSAFETALNDRSTLNTFMDNLSYLFNNNAIARGLIGTSGQMEAVLCTADTLADAYLRRYKSKEKQENDLALSRAYRNIGKDIEKLFGLDNRRGKSAVQIKRELANTAGTLGKQMDMHIKLSQGTNFLILAVWILVTKYKTNEMVHYSPNIEKVPQTISPSIFVQPTLFD